HPVELVRAVLPLAAHPSVARERVEELDKLSGDADFLGLASTMQRVRNIVPQGTAAVTRVSTPEPADTLLADTIRDTDLSGQDRTLAALSNAVQPLVEAVSTFFDEVLVNAEDPTTRSERMGLLVSIDQLVTAHISLDWAALPKDLRAACCRPSPPASVFPAGAGSGRQRVCPVQTVARRKGIRRATATRSRLMRAVAAAYPPAAKNTAPPSGVPPMSRNVLSTMTCTR